MASDWTAGYVADVAYTHGFYRDMTPSHLRFALLLKTFRPPEGAFTYCELGFGQGFGLNLLAAANPEGEFWGTDFNPSHAAGARLLGESAGADNLHVFDRSFAEFLASDLPDFDFICLHGVWTWVSDENRRLIVEFLHRRLKPGGVVYISYNTLPGWAGVMPLRELMTGHAALTSDPMLARIDRAVEFAGRVKNTQAGFFPANPLASARLDRLSKMNRNYLAHEYFNRDWRPFYFFEVARELAAAKLSYAGSANLTDHVDAVNLKPEAQQLLSEVTEPTYRETVRDFLTNQNFRRDLFVRGAPRLSAADQAERLMSVRATLLSGPEVVPLKRAFPVGELDLRADIYQPILAVLAVGSCTLGELARHPTLAALGVARILQAITLLTALGNVSVTTGLDPEVDGATRRRRADRFNACVLDRSRLDDEMQWLASPFTAGGASTSILERLFLLGLQRGEDPPAFAHRIIWGKGQRLMRPDGTAFSNEAEMLEEGRQQWRRVEESLLPVWRRLGIA